MNTFSDIAGHEKIIDALRRACGDRLYHAYIFDGAPGSGKTLMAAAFAKAILCQNRGGNGDPCGVCVCCRTIDSGNNPDVRVVLPKSGKMLGVDDIREQVVSEMETRPYLYSRKIFILENAGEMTAAAQNAFLKTLEQPKDYGVFLLLANNSGSFLPTILSRAVCYRLKPLPRELVYETLLKKGIAGEAASVAAVYGQGSVGKSIRIAGDEGFLSVREKTIEILSGITQRDLVDNMLLVKELEQIKTKNAVDDFLDVAALWYRDIAVYQQTGNLELLLQADGRLPREAKGYPDAAGAYETILKAKSNLKHNANFQLTMEILLLKLMMAFKEK